MRTGPQAETGDLIKAARGGDGQALDQLFRRYLSYLTILASSRVGGTLGAKVGASDVVQDALVLAYRKFPMFRGETEAEWLAWLRKILSRSLVDVVRRFRGAAARDVSRERTIRADLNRTASALGNLLPAGGPTPSQVVQHREQGALLAEALAQISDDQRQIVILRSLRSLRWTEAAREMGRSAEAVRKLWARAILKLGMILEGRKL